MRSTKSFDKATESKDEDEAAERSLELERDESVGEEGYCNWQKWDWENMGRLGSGKQDI